MILISGLGNPGTQYAKHRHNIGFMFIDYIASHLLVREDKNPSVTDFSLHKSLSSEIATTERYILSKPQTFMNRSGQAISKIMQHYRLSPNNVYVAFDDLDIPFGKFKIVERGPQIHNGNTSIKETIGDSFLKIRIGVDNRSLNDRPKGDAYVLSNFTHEEFTQLEDIFPLIWTQLQTNIRIRYGQTR